MFLTLLAICMLAGCGSDDNDLEGVKQDDTGTKQGSADKEGSSGGSDEGTSQGGSDDTTFCVEGKTWILGLTYVTSPTPLSPSEYIETTLKGDTVVEDIKYMKLYSRGYKAGTSAPETWTDSRTWLGEDGGKVYKYYEDQRKTVQHFDFSVKEHDKVSWGSLELNVGHVYYLKTPADGQDRKTICLYFNTMHLDTWVEGIGSLVYGVNDVNIGTVGVKTRLERCSVGNAVIFDCEALENQP